MRGARMIIIGATCHWRLVDWTSSSAFIWVQYTWIFDIYGALVHSITLQGLDSRGCNLYVWLNRRILDLESTHYPSDSLGCKCIYCSKYWDFSQVTKWETHSHARIGSRRARFCTSIAIKAAWVALIEIRVSQTRPIWLYYCSTYC